MISRRNIRVKVMQSLYILESTEEQVNPAQAQRLLTQHLDQSRELFVYLLYLLTETARYAETDARQRASKHLPSAEDLNVNTRIAGNEILWKILEDNSFIKAVDEFKPQGRDNKELIRKLYLRLIETPAYQDYMQLTERNKKSERKILETILQEIMLPAEEVDAHLEELFVHWDDDSEMMQQLLLNYLAKPGSYNLQDMLSEEKRKFAQDLLRTAIEKKEICLDHIRPRLKNWDPERIALLDMIMMRLGVCELLYFETIPAKVTINEYIDLAKEYSTPQSGQFVNGILDNIHKDLQAQDRLHKVSYKKENP